MRLAIVLLIPCLVRAQELEKITGRVIESTTKAPIANATVTLQGEGSPLLVLTDGLGTFTFLEVPPGRYSLNAQRPGYDQAAGGNAAFNLDSSAPPKPFEITLRAAPLLAGIVTGENGTPIPNATIQIFRRDVRDGEAVISPMSYAANDLGEYRVVNLQPGRYLICATASTSAYKQHRHLVYGLTCHPGVSDPDSAQWIDLQSGAEAHVDLRLSMLHAIRVTGIVRGASDHVGLSLQRLDRRYPLPFIPLTWDNKSGTFTVPALAPGDYILQTFETRDGEGYSASVIIHAGTEDLAGIAIDHSASLALAGTVAFDDEGPTAKGRPFLNVQGETLRLYAPATGDFRIAIPPPGSYLLLVQPPPGYYVASATEGGVSVLDRPIDITADAAPAPLEIHLAKGGGELKLAFARENSAYGEPVKPVLLRRAADGNGYLPSGIMLPATNTDYSIRNVAPGEYVLFIVPNDPNLEYMDPAWLNDHESSAIPVSIQDGQTTTANIKTASR